MLGIRPYISKGWCSSFMLFSLFEPSTGCRSGEYRADPQMHGNDVQHRCALSGRRCGRCGRHGAAPDAASEPANRCRPLLCCLRPATVSTGWRPGESARAASPGRTVEKAKAPAEAGPSCRVTSPAEQGLVDTPGEAEGYRCASGLRSRGRYCRQLVPSPRDVSEQPDIPIHRSVLALRSSHLDGLEQLLQEPRAMNRVVTCIPKGREERLTIMHLVPVDVAAGR
jgi:hypothetical protein